MGTFIQTDIQRWISTCDLLICSQMFCCWSIPILKHKHVQSYRMSEFANKDTQESAKTPLSNQLHQNDAKVSPLVFHMVWLNCPLLFAAMTIRAGGNVLVPCYSSGVIYDLLECLYQFIENANLGNTPFYFISPVANSSLEFSQIFAEWSAYLHLISLADAFIQSYIYMPWALEECKMEYVNR